MTARKNDRIGRRDIATVEGFLQCRQKAFVFVFRCHESPRNVFSLRQHNQYVIFDDGSFQLEILAGPSRNKVRNKT